jgi:hypothetical protein
MITLAKVKRCMQLLLPDGHLWDEKIEGSDSDLLDTSNGASHEYYRILDSAEKLTQFFLPYVTGFLAELEKLLGLPNEQLSTTERQGRVNGRMALLFAKKGRLQLYEYIMRTAAFGDVVVRTLGSNGTAESPFDFFESGGLAFYGNDEMLYGKDEAIYNNANLAGDAYLVTNGGSVNYFEDPETAIIKLENLPGYWPFYLVVEGPNGTKLQVPRRRLETFFDLVYLWKPGDMHVILNVEFTD